MWIFHAPSAPCPFALCSFLGIIFFHELIYYFLLASHQRLEDKSCMTYWFLFVEVVETLDFFFQCCLAGREFCNDIWVLEGSKYTKLLTCPPIILALLSSSCLHLHVYSARWSRKKGNERKLLPLHSRMWRTRNAVFAIS